jgi:mannitol-1-/sugar-/sorbitol-6-/2-deoxyglucose-6-phosphatase
VKAAIFDMDGLLIDSEPLWQEAEIAVFGALGLRLTREQCLETRGRRTREIVAYWYEKHPWPAASIDDVRARLISAVCELVWARGEPLPGVHEALDFVASLGMKTALASSSPPDIIEAVLSKLGIRERFAFTRSAEGETHGKPHPALFLATAEQLQVPPAECLVFEDSLSGVIAAKAAGMTCVAVPDQRDAYMTEYNRKLVIADLIVPSLLDFGPEQMARLRHG